MHQHPSPWENIIAGVGLTTLPLWVQALEGWLQLVAIATGAVLGIVGVYRLLFRNHPE